MISDAYSIDELSLVRRVSIGDKSFTCRMDDASNLPEEATPWARWWLSFLKGSRSKPGAGYSSRVMVVDLFCGCGGLTIGACESLVSIGAKPVVALAVDMDPYALDVYSHNLDPLSSLNADASSLVDYQVVGWGRDARFAYLPIALPGALEKVGKTDLLIAGPPCQGHSSLNNRTRRNDPRNLLYLDAVAAGVALGAGAIIVENVPGVLNDRSNVVDTAVSLLATSGYNTATGVLSADELGLPQTRKRFFLVASRKRIESPATIASSLTHDRTTVGWAIADLLDVASESILDSSSVLSDENRRRIDHLFDNDLHELPDHVRPECHRNGHTYPAVYGRLKWDEPSGTITTGFLTPGRGRFVHPLRRRTLTPREASRLQGFPGWYSFDLGGTIRPKKASLSKWIGDSVPPILGLAAVLCVLPGFVE